MLVLKIRVHGLTNAELWLRAHAKKWAWAKQPASLQSVEQEEQRKIALALRKGNMGLRRFLFVMFKFTGNTTRTVVICPAFFIMLTQNT